MWLRGVVEEKRAGRVRLAEAFRLLQGQALLDQLHDLRASAARWRLIGLVALIALVATVAWHILCPQ